MYVNTGCSNVNVPHTWNRTAQSLKWPIKRWMTQVAGSCRIFLFTIIPSPLFSWYWGHTLTTLPKLHLKFTMHGTLPPFLLYLSMDSFLCTEATYLPLDHKNLLFTKLTTDKAFILFWSYFRIHFYKHNMNIYFNTGVESEINECQGSTEDHILYSLYAVEHWNHEQWNAFQCKMPILFQGLMKCK
jgi:hypothetical protein